MRDLKKVGNKLLQVLYPQGDRDVLKDCKCTQRSDLLGLLSLISLNLSIIRGSLGTTSIMSDFGNVSDNISTFIMKLYLHLNSSRGQCSKYKGSRPPSSAYIHWSVCNHLGWSSGRYIKC